MNLPPWLPALLWPVAAVAAYILTNGLLQRPRGRWRAGVFAAFLLPALLGAGYSVYYLHVLPEPAWFYEWRSWTGTEVLVLAPAVAGAALAGWLPRWARLPLIAGVVFLAFLPFAKPLWAPLDRSILRDFSRNGVVRQTTLSTCGPASAATVLRSLGIPSTEPALAIAARSTGSGTEAWYLARAIRQTGARTKFLTHLESPELAPFPCIAGVKLKTGTGHFIALLGREGERFHVGDPLRNAEFLTLEELRKQYEFTGFFLAIQRE